MSDSLLRIHDWGKIHWISIYRLAEAISDQRNPDGGAAASAPITPATAIHAIGTFPTGDRGREGNDWRLVQNNDRHQSIALYLNPVSVEASQLSTHLSTCKVKLLRRAPHLPT